MSEKNHTLDPLAKEWREASAIVAIDSGYGRDKSLRVNVRFDGHGNSVVRFVVSVNGEDSEYQQFDAAVYNYNQPA